MLAGTAASRVQWLEWNRVRVGLGHGHLPRRERVWQPSSLNQVSTGTIM
jgi:hypothetical protein